jgi:chaperonin GroES
MKLIPLKDRVILKPLKAPEKQKGIILVPDQSKFSKHFLVHAIGDEVESINVNDHVLLQEYAGSHYEVEGDVYVVAFEKEIVAIVEDLT